MKKPNKKIKLLKDDFERSWYLIKEFKTKSGLLARIHQCVWKQSVVMFSRIQPHYTGYVQVPKGFKMEDTQELEVHGGVTFGYPHPSRLLKSKGLWVGFDMAHYGDENRQDLGYVIKQCEKLAKQIIKK